MVTALLLPLEWGGVSKPWNDPSVIALFPVFGFLLCVFIAWEWRMGKKAILPLNMFTVRTLTGAALISFFIFLTMITAVVSLRVKLSILGEF